MRKLSDLEVEELNQCLDNLKASLDYMCICDRYRELCNTTDLIVEKFDELQALIMKRYED